MGTPQFQWIIMNFTHWMAIWEVLPHLKISRRSQIMLSCFCHAQDDKESHVVVARMEKEHPWIQKEQAI
jgi:hypothetical protein